MACLRLYGDPAAREMTHRVLAGYGANVEEETGTPDTEVLCRVVNLLERRPDLHKDALVVRGRSFMLGSDPARLQSLMY